MSHKATKISGSESWDAIAIQLDEAIKQGSTASAITQLQSLSPSKVPRSHCLVLAQAARRVGLNSLGLELLTPLVRPQKAAMGAASDAEICEYAVLLSRVGSIDEAKILLNQCSERTPEANLYLAFCDISQWNYFSAKVAIEKYIKLIEDPYQQLVAEVNLAACFTALGDHHGAMNLLPKIIERAKERSLWRLAGNCYELQAQNHIEQRQMTQAIGDLNQADELLNGAQSYDTLFTLKWRCFIKAIEERSAEPLQTFRRHAQSRGHWESVRDTDLMQLRVKFEGPLFQHLYVGTPSPHYRNRVTHLLQQPPASNHLWGGQQSKNLNLGRGELDGQSLFAPGKKLHRLLQALCSDLYSPCNVGALHSQVYPGEYFNIFSTPVKIRQLVFRLRQELFRSGVPLKVINATHFYSLEKAAGLSVELTLESNQLPSVDLLFKKLFEVFSGQPSFRASQACEVLGVSRTQFLRLAEDWTAQNQVVRSGQGRATRYQIKHI